MQYMLDIETLGIEGNAVIPEIALVSFNCHFNIEEQCVWRPDILQQIAQGRSIDYSTVSWWQAQDQDVFNDLLLKPSETFFDVALDIAMYLKSHVTPTDILWANGLLFDVVKMDSFLGQNGHPTMSDFFSYNRMRDYRTIRDVVKEEHPEKYNEAYQIVQLDFTDAKYHDATTDCLWQIGILRECYRIIGANLS